jgi:hypothetical protein
VLTFNDGVFDAEKVPASIGPSPVQKKKATPPKDVSGESSLQIPESNDEPQDPRLRSKVDQEEVMDSLYRAVSAVGGGRYKDDPDAKAKQQASFEEFTNKENELRQSLDKLDEAAANIEIPTAEDTNDFDDVKYAEEVISSLGARPQPKRSRIEDEGNFSDIGGALASKDEDETLDEEGSLKDADSDESDVSLIPEWLRKENEEAALKKGAGTARRKSFLGSDIDEVFDDTDYEHNMRQLGEYERRRAGNSRQMGIDISDVLGRSVFQSDDYADYKYDNDYQRNRQDGWGAGSFEARKNDLLDYIELDMIALNALMDHKDSVYTTGTCVLRYITFSGGQ